MATLDIMNNDAFSVTSLTKAINDTPFKPGRLGELGLFSEEGISTTSMMIEKQGSTLTLVPNLPRGASATPKGGDKSQLVSIATTHLPQRATIGADQIQGVRAFGTESELETVQGIVNKRLAKLRGDLDVTIEYQRMGAIKGLVLDADGSTVLLDLNSTFGTTQQTKNFVLATAATNIQTKAVEAKRQVEAALGNLAYSGLRAICSQAYFDAFVSHSKVQAAFDRWMSGEFLRSDNRSGFYFAGIFWEEYRGAVGGNDFIESGSAYLLPEGVTDLFVTNYAPADYMETVNTMGLPYYAKQELKAFGKGVEIESQSNPISICTRPNAVLKLTAA